MHRQSRRPRAHLIPPPTLHAHPFVVLIVVVIAPPRSRRRRERARAEDVTRAAPYTRRRRKLPPHREVRSPTHPHACTKSERSGKPGLTVSGEGERVVPHELAHTRAPPRLSAPTRAPPSPGRSPCVLRSSVLQSAECAASPLRCSRSLPRGGTCGRRSAARPCEIPHSMATSPAPRR